MGKTHLHVTSSPIQVHVEVLDLSVFAKELLQVFLARFFVDVGDEDDPAFDGANGHSASRGTRVGGGRADTFYYIEIHFCGCHIAIEVRNGELMSRRKKAVEKDKVVEGIERGSST